MKARYPNNLLNYDIGPHLCAAISKELFLLLIIMYLKRIKFKIGDINSLFCMD